MRSSPGWAQDTLSRPTGTQPPHGSGTVAFTRSGSGSESSSIGPLLCWKPLCSPESFRSFRSCLFHPVPLSVGMPLCMILPHRTARQTPTGRHDSTALSRQSLHPKAGLLYCARQHRTALVEAFYPFPVHPPAGLPLGEVKDSPSQLIGSPSVSPTVSSSGGSRLRLSVLVFCNFIPSKFFPFPSPVPVDNPPDWLDKPRILRYRHFIHTGASGGPARLPGPSRGDPFARSSLGEGGTVVHAAQPAGPWARPWPR